MCHSKIVSIKYCVYKGRIKTERDVDKLINMNNNIIEMYGSMYGKSRYFLLTNSFKKAFLLKGCLVFSF